jgi:hypothetical protein
VDFKLECFPRTSDKHHSLILDWWKAQTGIGSGHEAVASDAGYMIYADGIPVASIFLYPILNCQTALVGNPIANPNIDKETRRRSLSVMISKVESIAKMMGYDFIFTFPSNRPSKDLFARLGYVEGDKDIINYAKRI